MSLLNEVWSEAFDRSANQNAVSIAYVDDLNAHGCMLAG